MEKKEKDKNVVKSMGEAPAPPPSDFESQNNVISLSSSPLMVKAQQKLKHARSSSASDTLASTLWKEEETTDEIKRTSAETILESPHHESPSQTLAQAIEDDPGKEDKMPRDMGLAPASPVEDPNQTVQRENASDRPSLGASTMRSVSAKALVSDHEMSVTLNQRHHHTIANNDALPSSEEGKGMESNGDRCGVYSQSEGGARNRHAIRLEHGYSPDEWAEKLAISACNRAEQQMDQLLAEYEKDDQFLYHTDWMPVIHSFGAHIKRMRSYRQDITMRRRRDSNFIKVINMWDMMITLLQSIYEEGVAGDEKSRCNIAVMMVKKPKLLSCIYKYTIAVNGSQSQGLYRGGCVTFLHAPFLLIARLMNDLKEIDTQSKSIMMQRAAKVLLDALQHIQIPKGCTEVMRIVDSQDIVGLPLDIKTHLGIQIPLLAAMVQKAIQGRSRTSKDRCFFLFEKILIYTIPSRNNKSCIRGAYQYKGSIKRTQLLATQFSSRSNERRWLLSRSDSKKSYLITSKSNVSMRQWVQLISESGGSLAGSSPLVSRQSSVSSSLAYFPRDLGSKTQSMSYLLPNRRAQSPPISRSPLMSSKDLSSSSRDHQRNDEDSYANIYEYANMLLHPSSGVQVKDRRWHLKTYRHCFVASEAVSFLVQECNVPTREKAVELGLRMESLGFFHHVADSQPFSDNKYFFTTRWKYCLNTEFPWLHLARSASEVISDLLQRLKVMYQAHEELMIKFGTGAVRNLIKSSVFCSFSQACSELQQVDIDILSSDERLAFFINVYNVMGLHTHLLRPSTMKETGSLHSVKMLNRTRYRIGKYVYSMLEIDHAILRANLVLPDENFVGASAVIGQVVPKFTKIDQRFRYCIENPNRLVSFALNVGTASSPYIRLYTAENVHQELEESARAFLKEHIRFYSHSTPKRIVLPKFLDWFRKDFGETYFDLIREIFPFLPENLQSELEFVKHESQSLDIKIREYDWTYRYPFRQQSLTASGSLWSESMMDSNSKLYRFESEEGVLIVKESMEESEFSFSAPAAYLEFILHERKTELGMLAKRVTEIENSKITPESYQIELLRKSLNRLNRHVRACQKRLNRFGASYKGDYKGLTFKPSTMKLDDLLCFVPTNLHIQNMQVMSMDSTPSYYIITFGAPAAHVLQFHQGIGLKHLYEQYSNLYRRWYASCGAVATHKIYEEKTKKSSVSEIRESPSSVEDKDEPKESHVTNILASLDAESSTMEEDQGKASSVTTKKSKKGKDAKQPFSEMALELDAMVIQLRIRMDHCLAQALGALVTCCDVMIQKHILDKRFYVLDMYKSIGMLIHFESLLSTHRAENGMLSDMNTVISLLRLFTVRLVSKSQISKLSVSFDDDIQDTVVTNFSQDQSLVQAAMSRNDEYNPCFAEYPYAPDMIPPLDPPMLFASSPKVLRRGVQLEYVRKRMLLTLPLDDDIFQSLPERLIKSKVSSELEGEKIQEFRFQVCSVLFTQGINEQQSLAIGIGGTRLQEDINKASLTYFHKYILSFQRYTHLHDYRLISSVASIQSKLLTLTREVSQSRREKNVVILSTSADLAREVDGGRLTSCKSAKDRTAMSCTWEQSRILAAHHGLPESSVQRVSNEMRKTGVRRENAFKNIGNNRFAFNPLQRKLIPEVYRVPKTAGGASQS